MTTITVWILFLTLHGAGGARGYVTSVTVIDNISSQRECEALKARLWPEGNDNAICNYVVKVKQ